MALARQNVQTSTPEPWSAQALGGPVAKLTRLARGNSKVPSPPECARIGGALPETAYASEQFQFALVVALS
jgi:hypothetical protein